VRCPTQLQGLIKDCWMHKSLKAGDVLRGIKRLLKTLDHSQEIFSWEEVDSNEVVDQFTYSNRLGAGSYGTVYKVRWHGDVVAVKVLNEGPDDEVAQKQAEFLRELHVMSSLRSPYLVQMLGACSLKEPLLIVSEYLPNGDLRKFLKKEVVTLKMIRELAVQVLMGLNYIHRRNVMHRDLTPSNVLIGGERGVWWAKIADFGLARCVSPSTVTLDRGTVSYRAPEIFEQPNEPDQPKYTTKVDMFSFGLLLYFMFYGENPLEKQPPHIVSRTIVQGQVMTALTFPKTKFYPGQDVEALIGKCCTLNPADRPTAEEALAELAKAVLPT